MQQTIGYDQSGSIAALEAADGIHLENHDAPLELLVALTDDDTRSGVCAVASELQLRRRANPSALYVVEIGTSVPEAAFVAVALEEQLRIPENHRQQEKEMRALLGLDAGTKAAWPLSIEVGNVAAIIAGKARELHSTMVMMGLNRHSRAGRAVGRDTVHELMSVCEAPLFAVRPSLWSLPRNVVIAVDFSSASIRAAHLARRIVADDATIHLFFAQSEALDPMSESTEGLQLIQKLGVEAAFRDLVAELKPTDGMTIHTRVRKGDAQTELLGFCDSIGPDLVAIGSQRHRFLERLFLGSVARKVAADGRWSVLVTPPLRMAAV